MPCGKRTFKYPQSKVYLPSDASYFQELPLGDILEGMAVLLEKIQKEIELLFEQQHQEQDLVSKKRTVDQIIKKDLIRKALMIMTQKYFNQDYTEKDIQLAGRFVQHHLHEITVS